MTTIKLEQNWQNTLSVLLLLTTDGDLEGRQLARKELQRMAFLADQFGKPLCIEVYAMAGDTIASHNETVEYYDLLVRCDGEDPIEEYENLLEFPEELIEQLCEKYPGASFDEIGG